MKAVVVRAPGDIRWESVPDPQLPPGWARVDVKAVGICSSDIPRALHGAAYHYPIVLGHEIAGVVREVGEGKGNDLAGKRVAVAPLIPCGRCQWCGRGRYSLCDDYDYLGSRRDGGCAEAVIAPVSNLVELPESFPFESGALLEPASVAYHALHGRVSAGDRVVVIGAGPIGLLAVQWAQLLGAGRVAAVDPVRPRLDLARDFGAHPVRSEADGQHPPQLEQGLGGPADLVVIAAGSAAALEAGLRLAGKGGCVICLGLPHQAVRIRPENFQRVVRHELQISGSWNSFTAPYPGEAWEASRVHIHSGRLRVEPLITERVPLKDAAAAYRRLDASTGSSIKILLTR